jgi:hypothetical protein
MDSEWKVPFGEVCAGTALAAWTTSNAAAFTNRPTPGWSAIRKLVFLGELSTWLICRLITERRGAPSIAVSRSGWNSSERTAWGAGFPPAGGGSPDLAGLIWDSFGLRRLDAALESPFERQLEITLKRPAGNKTVVGELELVREDRAKRRRAAALQSASRTFVHT